MTEKYKKRLCELVGYKFWPQNLDCNEDIELAILIKAMWAINNLKGKYSISQDADNDYFATSCTEDIIFPKDKYNNSEQQALQAALIYILDNEDKK